MSYTFEQCPTSPIKKRNGCARQHTWANHTRWLRWQVSTWSRLLEPNLPPAHRGFHTALRKTSYLTHCWHSNYMPVNVHYEEKRKVPHWGWTKAVQQEAVRLQDKMDHSVFFSNHIKDEWQRTRKLLQPKTATTTLQDVDMIPELTSNWPFGWIQIWKRPHSLSSHNNHSNPLQSPDSIFNTPEG